MSKQVQLRGGTTEGIAAMTPADREVLVDTTTRTFVLGDGVTAGGKRLDGLLLNPPSLGTSQTVAGVVYITGQDGDAQGLIVDHGLSVHGAVIFDGSSSFGGVTFIQQNITYASSVAFSFNSTYSSARVDLTGNITFSATGHSYGAFLWVRVAADASIRNLAFPAAWTFIGGAAPASIAANKTGLLELFSCGTSESGVLARWTVQP
jgi:hypothetical protein